MVKRKVEWFFCILLGIGAIGHTFGTIFLTEFGTGLFVWCLSGSLACFLLVFLNALRIKRPDDKPIRIASILGNTGWLALVMLFGLSIHNVLDPRVLMHAFAAGGLLLLALIK